MNNLKFRAWDKTHEVYYNVSGINIRNNKIVIFMGYSQQRESLVEIDFDEVVIEQYTGLKDKNGKEIYVGDIVKDIHTTYELQHMGQLLYYGNFEVIGNIHENRDLLK